jgi:hypothetical protein
LTVLFDDGEALLLLVAGKLRGGVEELSHLV